MSLLYERRNIPQILSSGTELAKQWVPSLLRFYRPRAYIAITLADRGFFALTLQTRTNLDKNSEYKM